MNKLVLNKNSWHYRLASVYTNSDLYWVSNLCQYNRIVLSGIFNCLIGIGFCSLVLSMLLAPIFYLILNFIYGLTYFSEYAIAGVSIWGCIVAVCLLAGASTLYNRYPLKFYKKSKYSDSYISSAISAIKNKICVPVEFKD